MRLMGNLMWFLCGGAISGLGWAVAGLIWCATVVGIPIGKQFFKFAKLALAPLGARVA